MNIENEIIVGMMKSQEFLNFTIGLDLNPLDFKSDVNRWLYKRIINYYNKYNKPPTFKIIKSKIDKSKQLDDDDKDNYKIVIATLIKKKFADEDYIKDETQNHIGRKKLLRALHSSIEVLKKTDNPDEAERELLKEIYSGKASSTEIELIDWLDDWELRQEKRKLGTFFSKKKLIKTGIAALDVILGGIYPGEILALAGLTGRGKSILALNVGANALLNNENVLHVNSENPLWQTLGRYDARIFKLDYKIIQQSTLNDSDEQYADKAIAYLRKKLKSKLKVLQVTPNHFNILNIRNAIHKLKVTEGFEPSLIVLDSPELMNPLGNYKEYRLQKAAPYWDFKALLIELGIAGIATTQANKKTDEKIGPTAEDLAEAYDKARLVDKIVGILRTLEDKLKKEMTLHVAKNRDGEDGNYIKLQTDFSKIMVMD